MDDHDTTCKDRKPQRVMQIPNLATWRTQPRTSAVQDHLPNLSLEELSRKGDSRAMAQKWGGEPCECGWCTACEARDKEQDGTEAQAAARLQSFLGHPRNPVLSKATIGFSKILSWLWQGGLLGEVMVIQVRDHEGLNYSNTKREHLSKNRLKRIISSGWD